MKTRHRISANKLANIDSLLDELGIKYQKTPLPGNLYLLYFDIDENDPRWPKIEVLVKDKKLSDNYESFFEDQEIISAPWSRLIPTFERYYPYPEKDWLANLHSFYENYCGTCGTYTKQRDNFHIKSEPRLGENDFLTLFWSAWAFFITPKVFALLNSNQINGFEERKVFIKNTNLSSKTISQLSIKFIARQGLPDGDTRITRCPKCSIVRYPYLKKGWLVLNKEAPLPNEDIQLTHEWFGDGHLAFREVLISNRLSRIIIKNKLQGARLKPVKLA